MKFLILFLLMIVPLLSKEKSVPSWHAPVRKIAPERFEIEVKGHQVAIPYQSSHPLTKPDPTVKRLVISQHGAKREAMSYFESMHAAAKKARVLRRTVIVAPQFLELRDLEAHRPEEDGLLYFKGWREGDRSLDHATFPRKVRVSNFEMLDRLLLHGTAIFPKLEQIVVVGHSAGGQLVNRYSLASHAHEKLVEKGIRVRYIVYNPSSYVYLSPDRFDERTGEYGVPDVGPEYNRYKYGLDGPNAYLKGAKPAEAVKRFPSREVVYMVGEEDHDVAHESLEVSPRTAVQGSTRLIRSLHYFKHIGRVCGEKVYQNQKMCILPGVGHQSRAGFESPGGQFWIFDKGRREDGPLKKWDVENVN